jgi:hypothetical protein
VPHVRVSERGLKTTGAARTIASLSLVHQHPLRKSSGVGQQAKSIRKNPFSAQVRFGEPGAPVQFLLGSARGLAVEG